MTKLFCDLKTDEEKSAFFLSGRGYETGVIAASIQNDVAMTYHRCAEYAKELAAIELDRQGRGEPVCRTAIAQVCEGWTLPHDVRKILETALWAEDLAPQPAEPVKEVSDETLTAIYDAFGIGALAREPDILMMNLSNVIRRSRCLSAIERVLTVETPPDPDEGDDEPGEECLLRWGADPEGYAEHFKSALLEWQSRAALPAASVEPVAEVLSTGSRDMMRVVTKHARFFKAAPDGTLLYTAPAAAQPGVTLPADGQTQHITLSDNERKALVGLVDLAAQAFYIADDGEDDGSEKISVPRNTMAGLEKTLDSLDDLPDDQPGYRMGPSGKAEWALRRFFGGTTINGQAQQEDPQ